MRRIDPEGFAKEYLTPQELMLAGVFEDYGTHPPYRPLVFQTCPVGPNITRVINNKRKRADALDLQISRASMRLEHNLFMKLQELDELGNTRQDPIFLTPHRDERGRVVLIENPQLTERVYSFYEQKGDLIIARRSIEGRGPHPERL
jgi:hypothetical protein